MSPLFARPSREEIITAQYDTAEAVANYARAYDSSRPHGRFFKSRLQLVHDILAAYPGGELLDVGCGPGIMARTLLESRPDDFRITVLDQSPAMVEHCAVYVHDVGNVEPTVGKLEEMPFADDSFDVVLAMGVLEYADAVAGIDAISRVTRPGGVVIVSMLNPFSLYRFTEWFLYRPLIRLAGAIEKALGFPAERRHYAAYSGIRALPASRLRRMMRQVDLLSADIVYFDVTPTVPPLDRLPAMVRKAQRTDHSRTVTRGWRRWMGTGFVITARRKPRS